MEVAPTGEREFFFNNLQVDTSGVSADYNRNGVVDAGDYVVWRETAGKSVTPGSGADGNNDGMITTEDYNIWRSHYGLLSGAGMSGATVPEPSQIKLAAEFCIAVLTVARSSRRNGDGIRSCGG
jgi:hypothetical protein